MITNKTIKSKYQPKQTNVTWVDLNGKTPVEKHFINGKWREISGGSAGSSNPTEADATKVWQVTPVLKETKTEEFIVVPTQTFEANNYGSQPLDNTKDINKVTKGANAVITLDGVTYIEQVLKNKDELYISIDNGEKGVLDLYTEEGELLLDYSPSELGEHTISVSIIEETPIYDYNWAPGVKIPIPTAEDKGKILVVNGVEVSSKEYELAPTQTVTITEVPVVLQNTSNLDKFVEGSIVTVVIDNTTHTGTVTLHTHGLEAMAMLDNDDVVLYDEGLLGYHSRSAGTYEVSVSIFGKEYSYEYQLTDAAADVVKRCDLTNLECFNNSAIYTANSLQDILNDGYTYVYSGDRDNGELYIVKIKGNNPSYNNNQFIDCSPVVIPSFLVDMYESPWRNTTPVLFHACIILSNNNISYNLNQNVFGFKFNSSDNGYNVDKVKGLGIVEKLGKYILGAYWGTTLVG